MIESGIRDRQNEIQQNQHTGDIPWWRSSDHGMKWSLDPHHSQLSWNEMILWSSPLTTSPPPPPIIHSTTNSHTTSKLPSFHSFLASTLLPLSYLPDFFHSRKQSSDNDYQLQYLKCLMMNNIYLRESNYIFIIAVLVHN